MQINWDSRTDRLVGPIIERYKLIKIRTTIEIT